MSEPTPIIFPASVGEPAVNLIAFDGTSYVDDSGAVYASPSLDLAPSLEDAIAALASPALPTLSRSELKAAATARRWEIEVAGTDLGGVPVATDDRSKLLLADAARAAAADAGFVTRWKGSDGVWRELDASTVLALRNAVFAHVASCFAREEALHDLIDQSADADLAGLPAVIAAFWPAD